MPKRQRSDSAIDEARVSRFVDSCVNFVSSVTFTDIHEYTTKKKAVAPHVLVIGTPAQLHESSVSALPFYSPSVADLMKRLGDKPKTVASFVPVNNASVRLTISAIPEDAARTNCPYRADCISVAVTEAVSHVVDEEDTHRTIDIFVRTAGGSEVAVANAIARAAPHSFSCIDGAAERDFSRKPVRINVVFASRHIFTGGSEAPGRTVMVAELEAQCTSVQLCQRLLDTPTNYLDTVVYAEIAVAYGKALGVEVTTIKGEELREKGYGGIYAVGMGAQYPPHLVTLKYKNTHAHAKNALNIALVGKGMVYDCGGLAIKTATGMVNMKTDMGGSAAVLCGFIAAVRSMKANPAAYAKVAHLSVTLCIAENAIGPNAYRNGDIIIMKSGKSVEVINTDAEGRIVLGDGVHYASGEQSFTPDVLIDMATLTGAQGIATGTNHAALYVSSDATEQALLKAGRQSGDTCFPVLYSPEHHKPQYSSPCADLRNLMVVSTDAGVSCGGYFIEQNLAASYKGIYAHVDLAFPSFNANGGTGFGVSLVTEYLRSPA